MDSQQMQARAEAAQSVLNSKGVFCLLLPFLNGRARKLQVQMLKDKCDDAKIAAGQTILNDHEKNAADATTSSTDLPLPCRTCVVSEDVRMPLIKALNG